jgi:hypothetical protein
MIGPPHKRQARRDGRSVGVTAAGGTRNTSIRRGDGDSLTTALEFTRRRHRAGGYPGSAFLVRGYQLGWSRVYAGGFAAVGLFVCVCPGPAIRLA